MKYKIGNKLIYQDSEVTKFLIESPKYGNFECLIDTKNYDKIKNHKWCISYNKKSKRFMHIVATKNNKSILLHQYLTNKKWIDHIDGSIFNNYESNFRECTCAENMRNRGKTKNNTSGYKGISWKKDAKKWHSHITFNYKTIHLGLFNDKIEAAKAYNEAALKYHGEFARLNQI